MNCRDFATILEASRDTSRPSRGGDIQAELDGHARACAACSELLAAEARLQAALQVLRVSSRAAAVHSPAFDARVKRAVRQAAHQAAEARGPAWPRWPILTSALASAIAIGAIVAVSLREAAPTLIADAGGITASAPSQQASAPVLFSDGRVEVVSRPAPGRAEPPRVQPPTQGPDAAPGPGSGSGIVLVEWDL